MHILVIGYFHYHKISYKSRSQTVNLLGSVNVCLDLGQFKTKRKNNIVLADADTESH